jgi:hypothetical protein
VRLPVMAQVMNVFGVSLGIFWDPLPRLALRRARRGRKRLRHGAGRLAPTSHRSRNPWAPPVQAMPSRATSIPTHGSTGLTDAIEIASRNEFGPARMVK